MLEILTDVLKYVLNSCEWSKSLILLRSLCISCREASIYVESSVFLSGEHLIDQFLLYIQ